MERPKRASALAAADRFLRQVEDMDSDDDDQEVRPRRRRSPPPASTSPPRRRRKGVEDEDSDASEVNEEVDVDVNEEESEESEESESESSERPPRRAAKKRRRGSETSSDDSDDSRKPRAYDYKTDDRPLGPTHVNKIERILGHRGEGRETEYLVKYKDVSYHHVEWLKEWQVNSTWTGPGGEHAALRHYNNKNQGTTHHSRGRNHQYFDDVFLEVERLVASTVSNGEKYYLVKWQGMGYDQATWETATFVAHDLGQEKAIARFDAWNLEPVAPPTKTERHLVSKAELEKLGAQVKNMEFFNEMKLRDYQVSGVTWLLNKWLTGTPCVLGDEMGLGKTIQVLAYFESLRRFQNIDGPHLVIAPLATLGHWEREASTWTDLNLVVYTGSQAARDRIYYHEFFYKSSRWKSRPKFNVLACTYETVIRDPDRLKKIAWRNVVVDEGHRLKNADATLYRILRPFRSEQRVVLTGTPVQNRVEELYQLLRYLDPSCVDKTVERFLDKYTPLDETRLELLYKLLGPRLLRREKEHVEKSIPPKVEVLVKVDLTRSQAELYKNVLENNYGFLVRKEGDKGNALKRLRCMWMELRKVCNHPWLVDGAEEAALHQLGFTEEHPAPPALVNEALLRASGKLLFLDKLLARLRENKEQVLIFSQFTMVLDVLEDYCHYRKWPYERLDGTVAGPSRQRAVDRFQRGDDSFIFLISTRAGGCGINLTRATKVVIYDSDWNPQNDIQAQARCHRIGQKKEVEVYRLITQGTYEEKMFDVSSQKLGLDALILQAGQDGDSVKNKISKGDIERILKHGAYDLFNKSDEQRDELVEQDIDAILAKSKKIVWGANEAKKAGEENKSAVRGLSGFSKVKFDVEGHELEDDPDFWQKVLPEQIDALTLARRLNGANPPTSKESVASFMEELHKIAKEELEDDVKWFTTESLKKRDRLVSLVAQCVALPQFAEHSELLHALLSSLTARRVRTRKGEVPSATNGETDSRRISSLLRGRRLVLGRWSDKALKKALVAFRSRGYGGFADLVAGLVKTKSYPETDMLPETTRHTLVASRVESLLAMLLEGDVVTAKALRELESKDTKSLNKKGKVQKKSKVNKPNSEGSHSDSERSDATADSSEDEDEESEEEEDDAQDEKFAITKPSVDAVKSLVSLAERYWLLQAATSIPGSLGDALPVTCQRATEGKGPELDLIPIDDCPIEKPFLMHLLPGSPGEGEDESKGSCLLLVLGEREEGAPPVVMRSIVSKDLSPVLCYTPGYAMKYHVVAFRIDEGGEVPLEDKVEQLKSLSKKIADVPHTTVTVVEKMVPSKGRQEYVKTAPTALTTTITVKNLIQMVPLESLVLPDKNTPRFLATLKKESEELAKQCDSTPIQKLFHKATQLAFSNKKHAFMKPFWSAALSKLLGEEDEVETAEPAWKATKKQIRHVLRFGLAWDGTDLSDECCSKLGEERKNSPLVADWFLNSSECPPLAAKMARTTKVLHEKLSPIIEAAAKDPKPETVPEIRNLANTIKVSSKDIKFPVWWKARHEYAALRGLMTYGFDFAGIFWDASLGFRSYASEAATAAAAAASKRKAARGKKGKKEDDDEDDDDEEEAAPEAVEGSLVEIFKKSQKVFQEMGEVAVKIFDGEIKLQNELAVPKTKTKEKKGGKDVSPAQRAQRVSPSPTPSSPRPRRGAENGKDGSAPRNGSERSKKAAGTKEKPLVLNDDSSDDEETLLNVLKRKSAKPAPKAKKPRAKKNAAKRQGDTDDDDLPLGSLLSYEDAPVRKKEKKEKGGGKQSTLTKFFSPPENPNDEGEGGKDNAMGEDTLEDAAPDEVSDTESPKSKAVPPSTGSLRSTSRCANDDGDEGDEGDEGDDGDKGDEGDVSDTAPSEELC